MALRFFCTVIFVLFTSLGSIAQSVLSVADSTEKVYELSTLNREKELAVLVVEPANAAFLAEFDSLYGKWYDFNKLYEKVLTENIDDWEIALFETRNDQIDFLKNNAKKTGVSAESASLIEKSIKYNYWHLVLSYPILRSNNDTKFKRVVSLPRVMTDDFELESISNSADLVLPVYRKLLPMAITYFNSQEKQFIKYSDRPKLVKDKTEFAGKYLQGELLDYFQTDLIAENCPFLTASSARYFISNVYDENLQKYLLTVCNETLNKVEVAEKPANSKGKLDPALPKIMSLDDKPFDFSAYKGKVIYVDFWASWCGPCRSEFPKSREMHESLTEKQKKEIVFLYISIDESLDAWKEAVKKLKLEEFGENGHSYEVSGRYGIRTIPRYMIINQQGEIVEMEASRPSNPETLRSLLKLIEK
ncbi:MAG: TlpA family protein disulfide reductase [Spirosomaceae bacterium]|nr:TlpA family protein disulfide reductase [Spirosomataceae bacterium]